MHPTMKYFLFFVVRTSILFQYFSVKGEEKTFNPYPLPFSQPDSELKMLNRKVFPTDVFMSGIYPDEK